MGQRLEGYLTQFQKDQGYYLEEDAGSITLFKYIMGEMDETGKKLTNTPYNPVPIAIVPKGTTPKEQLIRKLLMMAQK